jgi:hypothetical protein
VSLVLVVNDVLQVDALRVVQVVEELLVEDESNAGYFFDLAFGLGVLPDEVGRDGDGQLATELFALKSVKGVPLSVGTNLATAC